MDKEFEDQSEKRVAELLASLKQVSAPNDFEFRVKARIAQGRPAGHGRGIFTPVFRVAAPLLLVLTVSAAFIFNYSYSVDPESVQVTAEAVPVPSVSEKFPASPFVPAEIRSGPVAEISGTEMPPRASGPGVIIAANRSVRSPALPELTPVSGSSEEQITGGGSFDRALRSAGGTILPPGISADPPRIVEDDRSATAGTQNARSFLGRLGIGAELGAGVWIVTSVRANSPASRSGIEPGDSIEAIDGLSISNEGNFNGGSTRKTFRIKREGKILFIDLK